MGKMNWQKLKFWERKKIGNLTPEQVTEMIKEALPIVLMASMVIHFGSQLGFKMKKSRWERFKNKIRVIRWRIGLWIAGISEEDLL